VVTDPPDCVPKFLAGKKTVHLSKKMRTRLMEIVKYPSGITKTIWETRKLRGNEEPLECASP
jgi:hypothetical protein